MSNMPPHASIHDLTRAERQDLFNAINSATPSRLRALIDTLCATNPEACEFVSKELLLKRGELGKQLRSKQDQDCRDRGGIEDSDFSDEETTDRAATGQKRSRQRYEICGQCEKEYDVMQNGKTSCQWHDGRYTQAR